VGDDETVLQGSDDDTLAAGIAAAAIGDNARHRPGIGIDLLAAGGVFNLEDVILPVFINAGGVLIQHSVFFIHNFFLHLASKSDGLRSKQPQRFTRLSQFLLCEDLSSH
jgi:hypothetical protein